jgi:transcriptional regulator with PAS, ATPase and Fis domain
VRIVAATNRNLEKEVAEGRFREDLYYRLRCSRCACRRCASAATTSRSSRQHFLKRYSPELRASPSRASRQQTMELLMSYKWPGNVRELENEVQRLVIQVDDGGFVMPEHLSAAHPPTSRASSTRSSSPRGHAQRHDRSTSRSGSHRGPREHGNNKSATAKTLGITREGLHKKLKGYGHQARVMGADAAAFRVETWSVDYVDRAAAAKSAAPVDDQPGMASLRVTLTVHFVRDARA